jgi:hypothetical protein
MSKRFFAVLALTAGAGWAQQYEVGAVAGAGFAMSQNVTGSAGTASAGFNTGVAFGGYIGHNMYRHLSGEVRYNYLRSSLRLASAGTDVNFGGEAHAVHYDLIFHTRKDKRTTIFAAVGGGMKYYRGTGQEAAYMPLSQFAYLTKTHELKPMISAGGGIKYTLSPKVFLRIEARDYITAFPQKVITPAPGQKVGGMVHDIVPMVGISYTF